MLTLYQAEWCPFSSAVREVLTELGLPFVARPVEPAPELRDELRSVAGTDEIPVLVTEEGDVHRGTRAIYRYLRTLEPWQYAAAHRRHFIDHRDARETDTPGQLIEYFRGTGELEAGEATEVEPEVVDVPEQNRYELLLGGRRIGLAAYRRRDGRIVFTHTEVDESCSGRGYGSFLARAVLDDARRQGLEVTPLCPFISKFIERHPEYQDLAAAHYRDR